ncbi:MAG: CBS domain-containing protein, partial [Phormidesmis sp. RL_2_1]|nr:CBS domain-containing protein [Phormidesmis sp. RL_2_1]
KQVRSLIVERESAGGAYGILTERDIVYAVTAKCADPNNIMVCEIMKRPCTVVEPDLSFPQLAQRFAAAGIQRAPVVKDQQLLGIVSITDIIMKSNVEAVELPDNLSQQIENSLRHQRLSWSEEDELMQESEVARKVLGELQTKATESDTSG